MTFVKHIYRILALALFAVAMLGCDEKVEEDRPIIEIEIPEEEKELSTYTVMYYASGGGAADVSAGRGLDLAIEMSMEYFERRPLKRNVKFTACVKWSKGYDGKYTDGDGETCRLYLDSEHREFDFELLGDNNYAINEPENIAEFIRWSKEVAPSDRYIIIFSGHGNGWHPEVGINDAIDGTRGILRDTDTGRYVSCEELNAALDMADTHFRMIFLGSCLMNTMEYVTALSQYCDYILASSHISIMFTTELNYLVLMLERDLEDDSDKVFVDGIYNYLYQDINTTITNTDYIYESIDFVLTDSRKVDNIVQATKEFTDAIMALYDENDAIGEELFAAKYGATISDMEQKMAGAYFFLGRYMSDKEFYETEYLRQSFTYDIGDIASKAASVFNLEELKAKADAIHKASKESQSVCYATITVDKNKLHHSVTFTNAEKWAERNYDESGYEDSIFDQRTGWSRLLKRNNVPLKF